MKESLKSSEWIYVSGYGGLASEAARGWPVPWTAQINHLGVTNISGCAGGSRVTLFFWGWTTSSCSLCWCEHQHDYTGFDPSSQNQPVGVHSLISFCSVGSTTCYIRYPKKTIKPDIFQVNIECLSFEIPDMNPLHLMFDCWLFISVISHINPYYLNIYILKMIYPWYPCSVVPMAFFPGVAKRQAVDVEPGSPGQRGHHRRRLRFGSGGAAEAVGVDSIRRGWPTAFWAGCWWLEHWWNVWDNDG